jgi:hypothetical protein
MSSWERWIKRYVWDEDRTPYFTAISRLTRRQADHELFAYGIFLIFFFVLILLANAASPPIAAYALSIVSAALLLMLTKNVAATWYLASAPLVLALFALLGGIPVRLGLLDHAFLAVLLLLWCRYAWRAIGIARGYGAMIDGSASDR